MDLDARRPRRRAGHFAALLAGSFALLSLAMPTEAAETADAPPATTLDQTLKTLLAHPDAVDYLLRHPESVIEALQVDRARGVIAGKQQELLADPDDLVEGDAKGDVAIVEFFDYRCPYCKAVQPVLDALLREDKRLRIVYKEFPVLGDASTFATRAALAARAQGKYGEIHRALMAAKGDIDDKDVLKIAASVGLDAGKLKSAMRSAEIDRIIATNADLADALYVEATPAFVVGNTLIPGAIDLDALRRDIAAARKGS